MKMQIRKCKGRQKVLKTYHDCDMLFVYPFEKSCPNDGCETDHKNHVVLREFETEMPYSAEQDNQ